MSRRWRDSKISAFYDGESPRPDAGPVVDGQVRAFSALSAALRVPSDVEEPDPGFVARFRARRDALRAAMGPERWRWLALRLVPLSACALLTAGLVLWSGSEPRDAFTDLEVIEVGDGVIDITTETATDEPVLRIAFGEL